MNRKPTNSERFLFWMLITVLAGLTFLLFERAQAHNIVQINWTSEFQLKHPNPAPPLPKAKWWCWNQLTQERRECDD